MVPSRLLAVTVSAVTALALLPATGAIADDVDARGKRASSSPREYVVSFDAGSKAARSAIEAAGGTVVDVNTDAGIAKVRTSSSGFVAKVRRQSGIRGAVANHSIGTVRQGMPHRFAEERPSAADQKMSSRPGARHRRVPKGPEPLAERQWDMKMIGTDAAHRKATGKGVTVGIIDTGIDASHPDLKRNFDAGRSQNFTTDIPAIDGPCEVASCVDPANVDDGGHGTHVAGTVAADDNRFGIGGVAPDAKLVNLRAGQDSGYFFLYETVAALTAAGDMKLDVVNMSFYTDPWLFNCASRSDYVSGTVTDTEIAEQALVRRLVLEAVTYAHERGVTLVAAAGNGQTNYAAPTRTDATSPDYPADSARTRTVTKNCLDLPSEAPEVISVSSVGPSTTKADYSNYGLGSVEVAAPGGWFRDYVGTPAYRTAGNQILSSYPPKVAIAEGLADANGIPLNDSSVRYCDDNGRCGFYTYLQGTSMASPHAAGVAALIVDRYGHRNRHGGKSLNPDLVRRILEDSATDHACPAGGTEIYTDEGRTPDYNAVCEGTTDENGLYGEGIINAARAVGAESASH